MAIDGCLKWQAEGLNPPPAVLDATAAYLEAEDATAAWIEERCELDINSWETSAKLFASRRSWAELAGEFVGTRKQFAEKLESRGLQPRKLPRKLDKLKPADLRKDAKYRAGLSIKALAEIIA